MTINLESYRTVHFVGIGGIGMSALARLLLAWGHDVSGSDRFPGEQGEALARAGARVCSGHRAAYVDGADLVVVSSAVSADNPEVEAARTKNLPVVKRSQLLAAIVNPRFGVAVAGTHGKTTTTALIGHVLAQAGRDPTVLVGGVSPDLGSNARVGGDLVVAEADEYDASFHRLRPRIAVITNVEPDHLDFYGTVGKVHEAFRVFARSVEDVLVICADDPILPDLVNGAGARVITYGIQGGEWRARRIHEEGGAMSFLADGPGARIELASPLAGPHNVRNALAALAVAGILGVPHEVTAAALASFSGVERRFELKGEAQGVLVVDDYAHHPTEIRAVLAALKQRYGRPIRLVFQPHTYSRTRAFLDDFARSFGDAEAVYLLDIYAARERDTLGISGRDLAEAAARLHANVSYTEAMDRAIAALLSDLRAGDLVVTMGAGDVNLLGPVLLERLEAL